MFLNSWKIFTYIDFIPIPAAQNPSRQEQRRRQRLPKDSRLRSARTPVLLGGLGLIFSRKIARYVKGIWNILLLTIKS